MEIKSIAMRALGIYMENGAIKSALLRKDKNKIEIEKLQTLTIEELSSMKEIPIVTGLEASEMMRREVSLKLKKEREILEILPFQTESLIPYPADETILLPFLYPKEGGLTDVVLFATRKTHLQGHLDRLGIEPDMVSSTSAALARWGEMQFPEQKNFAMIRQGTCMLFSEGRISISYAFEPKEKEEEKMIVFVKSKCPDVFIVKDEEPYAIPIGLALDFLKNDQRTMQFLQGNFTSKKEASRRKRFTVGYIVASLTLALATWGIGAILLGNKESKMSAELDQFVEKSDLSLEERILNWEASLKKQKRLPIFSPKFKVSDVLAWISNKQEAIEVVHLHYSLVKNEVKVDLEFTAESPTVAREFHDMLLNEKLKDVTWNVSQDKYKTSFYLR